MRLSDEQKESDPDEQTTAVVDYLKKENDYKDVVLAPTKPRRALRRNSRKNSEGR